MLATNSKYTEPKPGAQARKLTMKCLGLEVETERPDEAFFDELWTDFVLPLTAEMREAMETYYFSGTVWRA